MLNQLLANLIDNGLCHTPAGTTIEVGGRATAKGVLLTVKDDGRGVPETDLPNLTKRFYRVDSSRTRPGTGLGLTLVAAIVALHKGNIKFANENAGLSVEVTFPHGSTDPRFA